MDDLDLPHELSVSVVYVDEHLFELEATLLAGLWRGRARAYSTPPLVSEFAGALERFADGGSAVELTAGADNGIGMVALRFYRIDRAGHIACHIRLASGGVDSDHRPEQVSRLAKEVQVEAYAAGRFALQLDELARNQSGQACMALQRGA